MTASHQAPHALPAPDDNARAHSRQLQATIAADIDAAGGFITFERYMDRVLYTPGLGYYSAGAQKFGASGDFITAPEVAPLFSRVVARQWEAILDACNGDTIVELGAGSGALAQTALLELAQRGTLPRRYWILETSATLRARQQTRLTAALPREVLARVEWLDSLPQTAFRGVIFGNEVLDALPVALFTATDDGLQERGVRHDGAGFMWSQHAPRRQLADAVAAIENELQRPFPIGYQSEINLGLNGFIKSLAACVASGALLFIDYGLARSAFYLGERNTGTLMCHYRHRAHDDPFIYPGLQDITAHVDFTAVAEAGEAAGLDIAGYTTQAHFLLGGGLETIVSQSDPDAVRDHLELTNQVKKLTSPAAMGEHFKAILLEKNADIWPSGFELRDLTHQL